MASLELRNQVESIVYRLLSGGHLSADDESSVRNFLYLEDSQLEEAYAVLSDLEGDFQEVESEFLVKEKTILDEHLAAMKSLQTRSTAVVRQHEEAVSENAEDLQQESLLKNLNDTTL